MATTVRVDDEGKRELDRLQGEMLAERGERVSHSELLARLLRFARARDDEFLAGGPRPTRADVDRLLARAPAAAVRSRARDVDRALYGLRP